MRGHGRSRPPCRRKRRYFGALPLRLAARPLITQLFSFLSVGALATALQYVIAAAGVLAMGLDVVVASTVGFLISAAFNYWANARLTFAAQASHAGHRGQQLRFAAMVALGCALNALLLRIAVGLGIHAVLGQLLATAGVLASNFTLGRLWVFRRS